jgi:LysR family transcriptional regulator, regulator for genes of the gallate degradation pathway
MLRLPSLRQLRTFAAVARFESISRALAPLHLSQSAVTQAIAGLEAKLDVPLFVRRSKGSYLTEYGKIFEKRTIRLFETIEGAIRELGDETDPVHRMSAASTCFRITSSQLHSGSGGGPDPRGVWHQNNVALERQLEAHPNLT